MSLLSLVRPYIGATVGMLVVAVVSFAASKALGESRPVNSYIMTSGAWEFSGNTGRNSFTGLRVRNCSVIEGSVVAMAMIGGEITSEGVDIKYTDRLTNTSSKGSVYLGSIIWSVNSMNRSNKLGFRMAYQCSDQIVWGEYWYELPHPEDRLFLH